MDLKNFHHLLWALVLITLVIGCDVKVDVKSDSFDASNKITGFSSPSEADFTSESYYDFTWPGYVLNGSDANSTSSVRVAAASEDLYHISVYADSNCSTQPVLEVDQGTNEYRLNSLNTENQPMTLGVQVRFADGTLGPVNCSSPVEKDITAPLMTLTSSSPSPTNQASLTLTGTCNDNRKIDDTPVYLCIKSGGSAHHQTLQLTLHAIMELSLTLSLLQKDFTISNRTL